MAITNRHQQIENKVADNTAPDVSCSLIVSTYNWPEALNQTLISIRNQTVLPNEVIIADDGSGKETRQLIEKYQADFPVPLIHSWIEDKGFRLAKSRNEALKIARFDYIIQVDGDLYLNKYFVKDHVDFARKNTFVRGSRVLLNQKISNALFEGRIIVPNVLMKGATNFLNGLRLPVIRNLMAKSSNSIAGIRGCNMGFWRQDALAVNGYNEEIQGWGREDSEFIARLINYGGKKRNLRLGAVQFHIFHQEYDRNLLNKNDNILNHTLQQKVVFCANGITKSVEKKAAAH